MMESSKKIFRRFGITKHKLNWKNKYCIEFEPKYYCSEELLDAKTTFNIWQMWLSNRKKPVIILDKNEEETYKIIQEILNEIKNNSSLKLEETTLFYLDLEYILYSFIKTPQFEKILEEIGEYIISQKYSAVVINNIYLLEYRGNSEFSKFISVIKNNAYIIGFSSKNEKIIKEYADEYLLI